MVHHIDIEIETQSSPCPRHSERCATCTFRHIL